LSVPKTDSVNVAHEKMERKGKERKGKERKGKDFGEKISR